ncbi:MAG TPA: chemotaxis protein CheW, partial [Thermoanaerobaculia bacterium]|nr:chemotaxis protein CheW [Thermoanaerobaculia bacterium]
LQDLVMAVRMVPIEPLFRQMTRTVHDAAQACGKDVQLHIDGGDVEIDTRIVELIHDPLMHLVRNAVDHGIEHAGAIALRARREGPGLVVDVADDGRGFDRRRIVARAVALGMISADARLSDDEILALVFRPGFSTADESSGISGRGVGLDVVQKNVGALRGSIHVASEEGAGSTISIRLPLSLAMITALPLHAGGETFVLPLDSIVECATLPPGDAVELRGECLPALSLSDALDLPPGRALRPVAVVVRHAAGKAALIVDAVSETIHVLIRPVGKLLAGIPFIAGATVLNSGKVALILDVENLINRRKWSCCEE